MKPAASQTRKHRTSRVGSSELANKRRQREETRLFLFGKLSGLNDKDAACAAGYSVSVAENTKQRIWKPRVRAEFERLTHR
jgi:phage terminase small subunit